VADYSSCSSSSPLSSSDNEAEQVEVGSYSVPQSALLTAFQKLRGEDLLRKSSKGPQVAVFVDGLIENMAAAEVGRFTEHIVRQMKSCLRANKAGKITLSKVWRNFHLLRLSPAMKSMWQPCIKLLQLSEDVMAVSEMTMQLVLKRLMQSVVQQLTVSDRASSVPAQDL